MSSRSRVRAPHGTKTSKSIKYTLVRLAQLVERKTFNLVVVGSSPTVGIAYFGLQYVIKEEVEYTITHR